MAETISVPAHARGVRMAPRKVSLVASLVRGRTVADALVILQHTPKRAALPVAKAIESARANAVRTHGADATSLTIASLQVVAGPRLKRFRPAAMGRASRYIKRTSHISVIVAGTPKPIKPKNVKRLAKKPAIEAKETA